MDDIIELEHLELETMYPNDMLLDYLKGKQPMCNFFGCTPEKQHTITFKGDRGILKEILLKYNKSIDASDNTLANIDLVENESTYFVITGQQPGLFTGPLYTIYKTLSAINYAKYYSREDVHLIPCFWNASEDHDVEEVNNIWILNKENEVVPIEFNSANILGKSLENIELDKENLTNIIKDLENHLPQTDFSKQIFEDFLINEMRNSNKWGEYFSRLLSRLMKQYGLILIEPKFLRQQLKEYFTKLVSNPIHFNNIFLKTTEELSSIGYKPKMHKKENIVGLFYIDSNNNRDTITLNEKGIYEVNAEISFTKEEIINEIQKHPEKFSTNAIFRPLAQDTLFPTYIFVGGPSEIGYHIQIKDLYPEFRLTQPNLHFRMGATITERHINRIIEKYNVKITELVDTNSLVRKLLSNKDDQTISKYFDQISTIYDNMNKEMKDFNPELGSRIENRKQSIMKELSNIEKMYLRYLTENNQVMSSQLDKAKAYYFPNNKPQERMFNIFQYINKYNFKLIDCIRNFLSKEQPAKHVVLKCWMF